MRKFLVCLMVLIPGMAFALGFGSEQPAPKMNFYGVDFTLVKTFGVKEDPGKTALAFEAINKLMNGGKYITGTIAEELAYDLESNRSRVPTNMLFTDCQYQVLRLIVKGLTTKEIAQQLSISNNTVYSYRKNIFEKAGVRNDAELIKYATINNLVDITN